MLAMRAYNTVLLLAKRELSHHLYIGQQIFFISLCNQAGTNNNTYPLYSCIVVITPLCYRQIGRLPYDDALFGQEICFLLSHNSDLL